jgi:hypothetical protein
MCGNAAHALCALGSPVVSVWRGRGGVHGGSKAWASRGIESWGEGEASGEATAQGGVGGVLTKHGVLGGNGDVQGAGGVARSVAVAWSRAGWSAGWSAGVVQGGRGWWRRRG